MSIHLTKRLQAVADIVPQDARVIDVGTDHAMIPVWLAQTGRTSHIWASDIRSGPLQSAQKLIEETDTGDCIRTRLTDGLQSFDASDGDTVILAGMGGEKMVSILDAAPWVRGGTLLILEPQSKQAELRTWLLENGFSILHESLVKDARRIYPILSARQGIPQSHTEAELLTGRYDALAEDEYFAEYLDVLLRRLSSAAPYDSKASAVFQEVTSMKERYMHEHS